MKKTYLPSVMFSFFIFFSGCKPSNPMIDEPPGIAQKAATESAVSGSVARKAPASTIKTKPATKPSAEKIAQNILAKLVPVEIKVDESSFPKADAAWIKQVIKKLVMASDAIDKIFLKQVNPYNPQIRENLRSSIYDLPNTEKLFDIMYGPWNRFDDNKPFYGYLSKLPGAGFYPFDMTKEEFEGWIKEHPDDEKFFKSFFTVIVRHNRTPAGNNFDNPHLSDTLRAIPYSLYYNEDLAKAAKLLKDAAGLSKDKGLSKFLRSRAKALLSNNYHQSDMDWVKVDGPLEVVIGPYETYEDQLMGLKASFEAYITVRVPADTAELQKFIGYLPDFQKNLPVPHEYKKFTIKIPPLVVVNEIYAGGDGMKVPVAAAFALPNDPDAKGIKNIFLKNISRAKVEKCTLPIARRLLVPEQAALLDFSTYWMFVLAHETAHGLHPAEVVVDDKKMSIRIALKDLYSQIEEQRADIVGLWNLLYLAERKASLDDFKRFAIVSLALALRTARFGEDHAKGWIATYNFMREKGVYEITKDGLFRVNFAKVREAFQELATKLCMLEFTSNYKGAQAFINQYGTMNKEMKAAILRIADIPTDILPVFKIKEQMKKWKPTKQKMPYQKRRGSY